MDGWKPGRRFTLATLSRNAGRFFREQNVGSSVKPDSGSSSSNKKRMVLCSTVLMLIKILPPGSTLEHGKLILPLKNSSVDISKSPNATIEKAVQRRGREILVQDPDGSFVAPVFQLLKCASVDLETDRSLKGRMSQMEMRVGG